MQEFNYGKLINIIKTIITIRMIIITMVMNMVNNKMQYTHLLLCISFSISCLVTNIYSSPSTSLTFFGLQVSENHERGVRDDINDDEKEKEEKKNIRKELEEED